VGAIAFAVPRRDSSGNGDHAVRSGK
jgi:hypothetical protein